MDTQTLVQQWFSVWTDGDFENIPVAEDFSHTSPYGTVEGRATYLELVVANQDKFLGNVFEIHDEIYAEDRAAVRYTLTNDQFSMDVSEWFYVEAGKIKSIVAYYNIPGEISATRKLNAPD